MSLISSTQPIDYLTPDRITQLILLISALSTAIVAIINAARAKGAADTAKAVGDVNTQRINTVALHAQSIDSKLTDVALASGASSRNETRPQSDCTDSATRG